MNVRKTCIVWTHSDPDICDRLKKITKEIGYVWPESLLGVNSNVYFFGRFDSWSTDSAVLHDSQWPSPHWTEMPRFDGLTQMEELLKHWEIEPLYDESPLPYNMNKELAEETKKKFNLSEEQWDMMPPSVRDCLSGAEVKIEKVGIKNWKPVDRNCKDAVEMSTVLLTSNPASAKNDAAAYVRVGFFDGDRWVCCPRDDGFTPTHYCSLPEAMEDGTQLEETGK